jgi:DNA modification methylase
VEPFTNGYERIFVFNKPGADPVFNQIMKSTSDEIEFEIKNSKKRDDNTPAFYLSTNESPITNVITTTGFNKNEFKHIDPTFKHDAPCPMELYDKFINAYSRPGQTVLDMFCGSGQGLDCALRNGRNLIGYDVDWESIEFCKKRLEMVLNEKNSNQSKMAA